eukprot:TRINITY_DN18192_c0_g1_i1.p1 TRINITY_DN18192_c0_g1~~TRINITY_DN18192_c0_g1_i1.p1  ORF type:complete len:2000 (+),score=249.55 TRINITY_DN18192_c0_g1_i1:717-6002(+)
MAGDIFCNSWNHTAHLTQNGTKNGLKGFTLWCNDRSEWMLGNATDGHFNDCPIPPPPPSAAPTQEPSPPNSSSNETNTSAPTVSPTRNPTTSSPTAAPSPEPCRGTPYGIVCEPTVCNTVNSSTKDSRADYQDCIDNGQRPRQTGGECNVTCDDWYHVAHNAAGHTYQYDAAANKPWLQENYLYGGGSPPLECIYSDKDQKGVFEGGQTVAAGDLCKPNPCLNGPKDPSDRNFSVCEMRHTGEMCYWWESTCPPGQSTHQSDIRLSCDQYGNIVLLSNQQRSCGPADCSDGPDPGSFSDPHVEQYPCANLSTGDMCTPICKYGYKVESNCNENGALGFKLNCTERFLVDAGRPGIRTMTRTFTVPPGCTCKPNKCDDPNVLYADPNVENGGYSMCQSRRTGDMCEPKCRPGYEPQNLTVVCNDNSNLDARGSRCVPNKCNGTATVSGWARKGKFACEVGACAGFRNTTALKGEQSVPLQLDRCVSLCDSTGGCKAISHHFSNSVPRCTLFSRINCDPDNTCGEGHFMYHVPPGKPMDCSACTALESGDRCQCTCPAGYRAPPDFEMVCDPQGDHDATGGLCQPHAYTCFKGPTQHTRRPDVNYTSCLTLQTDDHCKPTCPNGTILTGSAHGFNLLCYDDGHFDGSSVACQETACMAGPTETTRLLHMLYDACNAMSSQQVCLPRCEEGYTLFYNNLSLALGGTATQNASAPNGTMQGFELVCDKETREYKADVSYKCHSNNCTGPLPYSKKPRAAYDPCNGLHTGDICKPKCDDGFKLSSGFRLTCDKDGLYDASYSVCTPYGCRGGPRPGVHKHINAEHCRELFSGQSCQATCHEGYKVPDPFDLVCKNQSETTLIDDGQYEVPATCDPYPCKQPTVTYMHTTYGVCHTKKTGELCSPTCDKGFTLSAKDRSKIDWQVPENASFLLKCNETGWYDPGQVRCVPNPCSDGPKGNNRLPTADYTFCNGSMTGQTCVPICAPGYTQRGKVVLTCDRHDKGTAATQRYNYTYAASTAATGGFSCTARNCSGGSVELGHDQAHADYSACNGLSSGQECNYTCKEKPWTKRKSGDDENIPPRWFRKTCETCKYTETDKPRDDGSWRCDDECRLKMVCMDNQGKRNSYDVSSATCEPLYCGRDYRLITGRGCEKCPQLHTGSKRVLVTADYNTSCVPINQVEARANYLGRLAVLARMECEIEDEGDGPVEVDWQLHPTQIRLGSSLTRNISGAVVGNCVFFVFYLVLCCIIAFIQSRCSELTFEQGLRNLRWPSCLLLPAEFLLAGTMLYSARLALVPIGWSRDEPDGWEQVLGVVVTLIIPFAYVAVWKGVIRADKFHARLVGPNNAACLRRVILGNMDWEDDSDEEDQCRRRQQGKLMWLKNALIPSGSKHFVQTQGFFFDGYTASARWFWLFESALGIVTSVLAAPATENLFVCEIRNWAITAMLGAHSFLLVKLKPMIALVPNAVSIISAGFQFLGMLMVAVSFRMSATNPTAAMHLSTAAGWLYFVNGLAQMVMLFYNMTTLFYGVYAGTKLDKMVEDKDKELERIKNMKPIKRKEGLLREEDELARRAWYKVLDGKDDVEIPPESEKPLFALPPCSPAAVLAPRRIRGDALAPPAAKRRAKGKEEKSRGEPLSPPHLRKSTAATPSDTSSPGTIGMLPCVVTPLMPMSTAGLLSPIPERRKGLGVSFAHPAPSMGPLPGRPAWSTSGRSSPRPVDQRSKHASSPGHDLERAATAAAECLLRPIPAPGSGRLQTKGTSSLEL